MGYESKFYAVKPYSFKCFKDDRYYSSEIVASLDCSKLGYDPLIEEFLGLFNMETNFALYLPGDIDEEENEIMKDTVEDRYGARICYLSDKKRAIKILKEMAKKEDYIRFKWLIKFIEMFKNDDDVYICHYGY